MPTLEYTLPDGRDIEFDIERQPCGQIGEIRTLSDTGKWVALDGADENRARSWLMTDERAQDLIDDAILSEIKDEWAASRRPLGARNPHRSEYT